MIEWITEWVSGLPGAVGGVANGAFDAFLGWFGAVLSALATMAARVLELLPDAEDLGLAIPSGWLVGYSWLDGFLPLHEAMTSFGLLVAAAAVVITVRVAIIAYHLIPKPGIGT